VTNCFGETKIYNVRIKKLLNNGLMDSSKKIVSNIDRLIITHRFCFHADINKIINSSAIENEISDDSLLVDTFRLPTYIKIYPISSCINSELLGYINKKYQFLLLNINTKEIFVISNKLKNFLFIFKKSVTKNQMHQYLKREQNDYIFLLKTMLDNKIIISPTSDLNKLDIKKNDTNYLNKYKIETIICDNYFKKIAIISDLTNQKNFILKSYELNDDKYSIDLFNNEIKILSELQDSPYFCKIIYFDLLKHYEILEYVEGIDLNEYLSENTLSLIEKLKIVKGIINIIAYLHEKNIIHGDIHISQFKIDNKGDIRLLDFELARKNISNNNKLKNNIGGVFEYFEPENIVLNPFMLLKGDITKEAEVYRVGITIYYILFSEYPFVEITWQSLYKAKLKKNPIYYKYTKENEQIPINILKILRKCLTRNPKKRFKSCIDVKNALLQMKSHI